MRNHKNNITLSSLILILSLVNIIFNITNTSALSYQSPVGVSFTFNPTLSINISSDLIINSLLPGSSSDSNIINVAVATNTAYGYTLSASTDSDYLTHSNNIDTFSSIGTNANYSNLEDFNTNASTNTWSYSYKDNSVLNPTWSNYSGLAVGTNTTLLDTNDNNTETGIDSIDFKIAAKADNIQPSGIYTGTVNFLVVTKPRPKVITDLEYLQDFADLDEVNLASVKSSMPIHSTFTLKDKRDEQNYTIAKLADNKIWMTKNLNLAGGTEITSELSDVPDNYTLSTANGFLESNRLPESSQEGFIDNTQAYVYNTGNDTDNCANPGCYSYYSWHAATAGSGIDISSNNVDAPYSICPKGWELPSRKKSDFSSLEAAYGSGPNFYNNVGPHTVPNFLLSGKYIDNLFSNGNSSGYCWSSTSLDSGYAWTSFAFDSYGADVLYFERKTGLPVRCLAR